MAKYKVVNFTYEIKDNGKGYANLYLSLWLQNENGNPAYREYRIAPDTRWPDVEQLTNLIVAGLTFAQSTGAWIELSDYEERMYLFLVLPTNTGKENYQVTAEKITAS